MDFRSKVIFVNDSCDALNGEYLRLINNVRIFQSCIFSWSSLQFETVSVDSVEKSKIVSDDALIVVTSSIN